MNEWPFITFPPVSELRCGERLKGLFLPKLFADMSHDCATGMLWLRSEETTTGVHWRSGEIVFALSSTELFSNSLLEQRLITQEQVKTLENFCRANNSDIYDALISLGYFNHSDLLPILKAHTYIVSYSCLDWEDGNYIFDQTLPFVPYELLTSVQIPELVLESTQNLFSIERLKEFLGSCEEARFVPSGRILPGDSYRYKEQAALIERLVSSINRYSELQAESEENGLVRILSGLVALGAVTVEQVDPLPVLEDVQVSVEAEEYGAVEATDIAMFFYEIENMLGQLNRPGTDYYSMLEVARQASPQEIEAAYRRLSRKFSLERCRHLSMPIIEQQLGEIQKRLNEAFSVLGDQVKRAVYTQTLRQSGSPIAEEKVHPTVEQKVEKVDSAPPSKSEKPSTPVKPAIDISKLRNPDDWYLLGLELLEQGDNDRAVKVFQNAIKLRPSDGEFHAGLARACDAAYGYNEQTVKMFEKAIRLNPSSEADYQAELGVFYLKHGRLEQAELRLSKSLAINPEHRVATKAISRLQEKKSGTG